MELPNYSDIETALRRLLVERNNKPLTAQEAYAILGNDVFGLEVTQKRLQITTAKGVENAWENRRRTARNNLVKIGAMRAKPFNTWTLTDAAFCSAGKSPEELGLC